MLLNGGGGCDCGDSCGDDDGGHGGMICCASEALIWPVDEAKREESSVLVRRLTIGMNVRGGRWVGGMRQN